MLEDESTRLSAVDLKQFIISGLRSLYGEVRSLTHMQSWTNQVSHFVELEKSPQKC